MVGVLQKFWIPDGRNWLKSRRIKNTDPSHDSYSLNSKVFHVQAVNSHMLVAV